MKKAENTPRPIYKKVFDVLYYVLITIIIFVALLYTVSVFSTQDGVTSIFGYVFNSIQTESMTPTLKVGDFIISEKVEPETLKEGDIITFHYIEPASKTRITVTHRISEIRDDGKIVTQGDYYRDRNSVDAVELISKSDVIAKYTGQKIAGLGKVSDFIKTKLGFFLCVLVPVFLFLFWQIYVFIRTLIDVRHINKEKAINDQARALAEQMLKEMQKADSSNSDSSSSNSTEA